METSGVLDQPENNGYSKYEDAGKGKRLVNYIIDLIFFYIVYFLITILIIAVFPDSNIFKIDPNGSMSVGLWVITILIFIFYYSLLEYSLKGKTIGKLITRTRAVTIDGDRLTFSKAFARSACRMIPFEPFSFLGSKPNGWHDTITDTRAIDEAK